VGGRLGERVVGFEQRFGPTETGEGVEGVEGHV